MGEGECKSERKGKKRSQTLGIGNREHQRRIFRFLAVANISVFKNKQMKKKKRNVKRRERLIEIFYVGSR